MSDFSSLFGGAYGGNPDVKTMHRILAIEKRLDSHDAALKKVNELLKQIIGKLEGRGND